MLFERLQSATTIDLEPGDIVFSAGEPSHEMYIVQYGEIAITKEINGREVVVYSHDKTDFFGELGLLEDLPRSATARAAVPTRLLVIYSGALLNKIRRDPTFAVEMLKRMSNRFRELDQTLSIYMREDKRGDERVELVEWKDYFHKMNGRELDDGKQSK